MEREAVALKDRLTHAAEEKAQLVQELDSVKERHSVVTGEWSSLEERLAALTQKLTDTVRSRDRIKLEVAIIPPLPPPPTDRCALTERVAGIRERGAAAGAVGGAGRSDEDGGGAARGRILVCHTRDTA
jgi:hypothetical protein